MIIRKNEEKWIESGNRIKIAFRINFNNLIKFQISTL
jgi:hypothetical protein